MTNVDTIFKQIVATGQHPRLYSDTVLLLEQIGNSLDKENHRIYRKYRDDLVDPELSHRIEDELEMGNVIAEPSRIWDGGYTICGTTGSGSSFVLRDPKGIRPAYYYIDDEVIVLASERPVIQTVFNVPFDKVEELGPGCALLINRHGEPAIRRILPEGDNRRCSFERVYFSRGSDAEIYRERKALGANIVPTLIDTIGARFDTTVFSFIPNTAEVAFIGMVEALNRHFDKLRKDEISALASRGELDDTKLTDILRRKVRVEKIAIKDIKLRTFIAEGSTRNDLAAHVYDVTYGSIRPGTDSLVVIDDSIVRGTTLKQSILRILDRLGPRRIIVVSSSPQVRYPDYYGIDMPHLDELAAFRAAVSLLEHRGNAGLLDDVYARCMAEIEKPDSEMTNAVKAIYDQFDDNEIADEMARMLRPDDINASVEILFQTLDGLHDAIPGCPGDWYFSGNYPTPGGIKLVNRAYINFYRKKHAK